MLNHDNKASASGRVSAFLRVWRILAGHTVIETFLIVGIYAADILDRSALLNRSDPRLRTPGIDTVTGYLGTASVRW